MKEISVLLLGMCLCVSSQAAVTYTDVETLGNVWDQKIINTGYSKNKPDIIDLVKAFNRQWKTEGFTHAFSNKVQFDVRNGYIEHRYQSLENGSDEMYVATIWRRKNGHTMLGITHDYMYVPDNRQLVMFYDYDPDTGLLTPDRKTAASFVSSHSYLNRSVILPHHGRDITVVEHKLASGISLRHTYSYDGMKHALTDTVLEADRDILKQLPQFIREMEYDPSPKSYTFVDVDSDGIPELWLSSENGNNQEIYSLKDSHNRLISFTYYKTSFLFYQRAVASSGGCGTMCFLTSYTPVENSRPGEVIHELTTGDFEGNEVVSYSIGDFNTDAGDDLKLSAEEGRSRIESLGKMVEITPEWHKISSYVIKR